MKPSEAKALVALLQAAYPGREMPRSTVALYTDELQGVEWSFETARACVRDLIRTARFLPSIAEVLDAMPEHVPDTRMALPAEASWTPEERAANHAAGVRVLAEFRERNHGLDLRHVKAFEDIVAKEAPKFDYAEVEAKREAARRAADAIRETAPSPDVPENASGSP